MDSSSFSSGPWGRCSGLQVLSACLVFTFILLWFPDRGRIGVYRSADEQPRTAYASSSIAGTHKPYTPLGNYRMAAPEKLVRLREFVPDRSAGGTQGSFPCASCSGALEESAWVLIGASIVEVAPGGRLAGSAATSLLLLLS